MAANSISLVKMITSVWWMKMNKLGTYTVTRLYSQWTRKEHGIWLHRCVRCSNLTHILHGTSTSQNSSSFRGQRSTCPSCSLNFAQIVRAHLSSKFSKCWSKDHWIFTAREKLCWKLQRYHAQKNLGSKKRNKMTVIDCDHMNLILKPFLTCFRWF